MRKTTTQTPSRKPSPLGAFLKELREKKGVSLLDVEHALKIPNAYISQLETGARRKLPEPDRLRQFADYYNISVKELLAKAGYYDEGVIEAPREQQIEKEFLHVLNNPNLPSGGNIKPSNVPLDVKQFIVELHTYHLTQEIYKSRRPIQSAQKEGGKIRIMRWKTDSVLREPLKDGNGVEFVRYRVKITCTESIGLPERPGGILIKEGSEKIVKTISGHGEHSQEASTVNGYESRLLIKATENALKNTLPAFKSINWAERLISPWESKQ